MLFNRFKAKPLTFERAERLYLTARDPSKGRRLRANTYLYKEGDSFIIRLKGKDIIHIDQNNIYTLKTGGSLTRTCADAINRYTTAHLTNRKSTWFHMTGTGLLVEFFDGLQVDWLG